jgi:hypothetical protein
VRVQEPSFWRNKGLIVPFLHYALISSIDPPKNIGDIGIFVFFYLYSHMLMILFCISLILAYSFVFLSLTLSSTAVILSKTQLGM